MSRAFVKEDDRGDLPIPERQSSAFPNYITSAGLQILRARLLSVEERRRLLDAAQGLEDSGAKRSLERDAAYLQDRIARAIVVDPSSQPKDSVAFGACVNTMDDKGHERIFFIVGEDEADPAKGRLSWVSPLARALDGAEIGDTVEWRRPTGDVQLTIVGIRYPNPSE